MTVRLRGALLVVAATVWGGCSLVGRIAASPHPAAVGPAPPDLGATEVWISVPDADSLAGGLVPAASGAPGVVLLHGVTDNRLRLIGRGRMLVEAGYAVLMVDLPGHGESPGPSVGYGWTERHAAAASVAYLRRLRPGTDVGVLGISLGGAASVLAGGSLDADALVLEMVYPTFDAAVRNRARGFAGAFGPVVASASLRQVQPLIGVPSDSLRPIDAIARVRTPTFVIGGEKVQNQPWSQLKAKIDEKLAEADTAAPAQN